MLRLRSTRVICAGPAPSDTSAMFMSGTGPFRPGTGQQLQALEIAARRVVQAHADRNLAVVEIELREARVDVAARRDARDEAQRLRRDAELRRALRQRPDHDLGLLQRRAARDHARARASRGSRARRWPRRGPGDSGSSPASVTCSRLPPPPLPNWKPRAGNVAQDLGRLALEDLLRAARAVGVVELDHERAAAHVARRAAARRAVAAALRADRRVDAAHLGQRSQAQARRLGDLERVLERSARRELHAQAS